MTDLQQKVDELNEQIDAKTIKAKKSFKGIFMALLFAAIIISTKWPFDKWTTYYTIYLCIMLVYISTFVYSYYSYKQKIIKLKDELNKLT